MNLEKVYQGVSKPKPMGQEGSDFLACIYDVTGTNRQSVDVHAEDLTAVQCRKLAAWLLKAAEWLEQKK